MQPLKLAATDLHLKEPVLQHAYAERNKTWNAEVIWSNGVKDPIDLQALLLEKRVDFYFVDLGILEAMQQVFEEQIAPYWENRPNMMSRQACLKQIKDSFRGLITWYLQAGYLRETIHETHYRNHSQWPESSQSLH